MLYNLLFFPYSIEILHLLLPQHLIYFPSLHNLIHLYEY